MIYKFAIKACFILCCLQILAVGQSAHAVVVAQYNLGEDDSGATAGSQGNAVTSAAVGNDLLRLGDPTYSATVPTGGSTLSMDFDGNGDHYYGSAPSTDLSQNFSYTFDANLTAASGSGFSFVASLGGNFGGITLLEGGPFGAGSIGMFLPATSNFNAVQSFTPTPGQWNSYQVSWDATLQQATFSVDGNQISQTDAGNLPANSQIVDALTLGGNFRLNEAALDAPRADGDFEGSFNGLIDNFVFDGTPPPVLPSLTVERDTGSLTLENGTGADLTILGYRITSDFGSLDADNWTSIASNYDASSPGPNQVDPDDNWTELSPNPNRSLSEFESDGGNGATLSNGATIDLGSGDGVTTFGPWMASHIQDVQIELLLPDGTIDQNVDVIYAGNGGAPLQRSDLDADGDIDVDDWILYRSGLYVDLPSGLSSAQAYFMGDLDGDFDNDIDDFTIFKGDFIAGSSLAAFNAAVTSVPEPSTWLLLSCGLLFLISRRQAVVEEKVKTRSGDSVCSKGFIAILAVGIAIMGTTYSYAGFETLALYNLGEDDPGAAIGGAVTGTVDAMPGGNDRTVLGTGMTYAAGNGGGLAVEFDGNGALTGALPTGFDGDNFRLTFDVNVVSTDGFDFFASFGGNTAGGGGYAILHLNEQAPGPFYRIGNPGRAGGATDAIGSIGLSPGTFQQIELTRLGGGDAELRVDGVLTATHVDGTAVIEDIFTIGSNTNNTGDALDGSAQAIIDNVHVEVFVPPLLTLEVNTTTGAARIFNDTGESIDFEAYVIESEVGALNPGEAVGDYNEDGSVDAKDYAVWRDTLGDSVASGSGADGNGNGTIDTEDYALWKSNFGAAGGTGGWNSLQDQDLTGFPAGDGTGNGWEEAPGVDETVLAETYLQGSSTLVNGAELLLGNAFDPSEIVVEDDLTFQYNDPNQERFVGNIVFVSSGSITTSVVPEPAAAMMLVAGSVFLFGWRYRNELGGINPRCSLFLLPVVASLCGLLLVETSQASFTLDREYKLGESDTGNGTPIAGALVGSTTSTGDTFDDEGTPMTNTFIDLTPNGNPIYADVSSRPLAGGSILGVSFDGVDDFLTGYRLGLPETSVSSTLSTQANELNINNTITGTLDYSGIANRGYQFWVNPTDASLGNGNVQSVVSDTNQHGVAITGTGTWSIQYGGQEFDSQVTVKTDGAADGSGGWHHIMLVRPRGAAAGAHLYVDGQAIAAIGGGYNGADANYLTLGASTGNLADADGGNDPGQSEFFSGVIDDLDMFVLGVNGADFDFGTFDFATDNEFAADALVGLNPADVDRSGAVNQADVSAFAPNFDTSNLVNGVAVGDLTFRDQGDLNFDGTINLADAFILHGGLLAAGFGGLDFSQLGSGVIPEPSTALLLLIATGASVVARRSRAASF